MWMCFFIFKIFDHRTINSTQKSFTTRATVTHPTRTRRSNVCPDIPFFNANIITRKWMIEKKLLDAGNSKFNCVQKSEFGLIGLFNHFESLLDLSVVLFKPLQWGFVSGLFSYNMPPSFYAYVADYYNWTRKRKNGKTPELWIFLLSTPTEEKIFPFFFCWHAYNWNLFS